MIYKAEVWKPWPLNPDYLVSSHGNVLGWLKGHKARRTCTPYISRVGYVQYRVRVDGKPFSASAHRMVAQTFLPNPDNLPDVNHLDEDKTNNRVENLCWMSHKDNCNYGTLPQRRRANGRKKAELWKEFKEWKNNNGGM